MREGEHEEVLCVALAQVEHGADGRVGVGVAGDHHVEAREFEVREEVGSLRSTNKRWHGKAARTVYGVLCPRRH